MLSGGIYALFAVGIVLVYRGSGVLNFAQGEVGTAGLFLATWLVVDHHLPWIVGALATLLRRTDFGLGVLAAAQDSAAARLVGVPVNRVAAFVWGTGAALSTIGCLLIAPGLGAFSVGAVSRLFLFGLAAAVLGGLTSL